MNIVQDLLITNKRVLKKTIPALLNNPVLLVGGGPYGAVFILGMMLASMVGFFGGIVSIIINSAIISDYLSLIEKIRHGRHVTTADIRMGYRTYLSPVWSLLFLLYFVNFALSLFLSPLNMMTGGLFFLLAQLAIYALSSAMPETIYQKHYDRGDMVTYGLNFVKENAIQWLLPNLILIGVTYRVYNGLFSLLQPIFGFGLTGIAASSVIAIIVTQGLFAFAMIYRAFLFEILSSSTLRKRLFMRHMYKD
jgi:hypothetical protein